MKGPIPGEWAVARLVQTLEVGDRAVARLGWAVANTDWRADLRSLTTRLSRFQAALERIANHPDPFTGTAHAEAVAIARTALDSEGAE